MAQKRVSPALPSQASSRGVLGGYMSEFEGVVIDTDEPEFGARFFWDESNPDKSPWAEFRIVPESVLREMRKKCTLKRSEYVLNTATRGMERVPSEEFDDAKFTELFWDYAITGWSGWTDKNKQEHPCTAANKVKFMTNKKFQSFAAKCIEKLREDSRKDAEDSEKNS